MKRKKASKATLKAQKILRAKKLIYNYRRDDSNRNMEMSLTDEWVVDNIFSKKCVYCGERDWNKLGCDRIDNTKGHTPDNVVCSCARCNLLRKDNFTVEEMKKIGNALKAIDEKRKNDEKEEVKMVVIREDNTGRRRKALHVAKCDDEGNVLEIYKGASYTEDYGYVPRMVRRACEKWSEGYTYRGYMWRYVD